jgi:hypothetical protein
MRCDHPVTEGIALRKVITALEFERCGLQSIDVLARDFGLKRRGIHDFLTICAVFGICRRDLNSGVEWLGLDRSGAVIDQIRAEVEAEGGDSDGLCRIFDYSADPSLQRISCGIVKLFFYLGTPRLDVRKAGTLFAQGKTKYKTMLRKLYTVVAGLELAGVLTRTQVVSEVQLNAPLTLVHSPSQFSVPSILNSPDDAKRWHRFEMRRREFERMCTET